MNEDLEKVLAQLTKFLRNDEARSRGGATIVVANSRLSLSSWEVAALLDRNGDSSEAIRRGVGARVLLFQVLQQARQKPKSRKLPEIVALAREEATRLRSSIAASRKGGNGEATEALSATTQLLEAMIVEAGKLSE
jgi:hypothetical protein